MAKGIIIDIGFKADIKDLLNSIEKDFKKVDFDSVVGLSDAFDKQAKDVREQLSKLKKEIDETINGKLPNDPEKQLRNLNKAVGVLTSTFKELAKNTNLDQTLLIQLDEISGELNEVSTICGNAVNSVKNLKKITNGGIQFVDSNQKKELEDTFKLLERAREASEKIGIPKNQHGNKAYEEADDALRDLVNTYDMYASVMREIANLENNTTLSDSDKAKEMDKLNISLVHSITNLSRMITTYSKLDRNWNKLSIFKNSKTTLEDLQYNLDKPLQDALNYISKRKIEIQQAYSELGGEDLQKLFEKGVAKEGEIEGLKIPLNISTRSSTLVNEALSIIEKAQEKLIDNPLEVEVKLISSYKSKANQKILNEISDNIQNVNDEEIRTRILSLIDNMNKHIDNALLFNVNVNTENATNAVKKFVQDAKDELSELNKNLVPLEPEVVLTDEHKQAFQKQLNEAKGDFKIQVGIMDGDDTVDNNATKKELSYLKLLRERVENVSNAVNEKSLAFIDEEGIVKEVIENERAYLNQLYADLILIESQIKDIIEAFKLIPEKIKIDLDDKILESLDKLSNHEALSKISDAKTLISSAINSKSGESIEIPEDQKNQLLKDIQNLSTEINAIFETKSLDNWTSKFLSSLSDISQKIQTLFGNNDLTKLIEEWNLSDELMIQANGRDHLRERAAVIDDKGNIHGSGTYDQEGSTRFISDILNKLKYQNIVPKMGIHSHGSDRIVASSIPQEIDKLTGDLVSFYHKYIYGGLEKQLTIAINDIEVFDAKGFYDSNKSVDFLNQNINNLIVKKKEEIQREISNHFYQFFEQFVSQYGSVDAQKFKDSLFGHIDDSINGNQDDLLNMIYKVVDPEKLLNNFYEGTKNTYYLEDALTYAFKNSFDYSQIDYESLGYSENLVKKIISIYIENIENYKKRILDDAFDISKFDYDHMGRDLDTFNFRQITPRILEEALEGTGYKNNYQDFMKVYSKEDFIKQNPLGLSSGTLSNLFDNSAPTTFLETLDKIVVDLKEIKTLSSSDEFSQAFNIKLDTDSIISFTSSINSLIEKMEELFAAFTRMPTVTEQLADNIKEYFDLSNRLDELGRMSEDAYNQYGEDYRSYYPAEEHDKLLNEFFNGKFGNNEFLYVLGNTFNEKFTGDYAGNDWIGFAKEVIKKSKEMGISLDDIIIKSENAKKVLDFSNLFNFNIDGGFLNTLVEEINKLVQILEKLPKIIKESFSGFNSVQPSNIISNIDNQIESLNKELEETERQIKLLEQQINSSSITNREKNQSISVSNSSEKQSKKTTKLFENILSLTKRNKRSVLSGEVGLPEQTFVGNIHTGYGSNVNSDAVAGITSKLVDKIIQDATEPINTLLHSHPEELTAAFSFDDIEKASKRLKDGIEYQIVSSLNDLAMLDVSMFTEEDLIKISEKMKELTVSEADPLLKQKFGLDYLLKDDEAIIYSFKNNFNESIKSIFDNIIVELKNNKDTEDVKGFEKELYSQLEKASLNLNDYDNIYESLFNLYSKVSESFKVNNIDAFDNAFEESKRKFNMEFQEAMLKQAINMLSSSGQLSTKVNFDDIYKKFLFEDFEKYLSSNINENVITSSRITNESVGSSTVIDNTMEEQLKALKEKHELLIKQLEILKEQKRILQSQNQEDTSGIDAKTDAFKKEGTTVENVIDGEINKLKELERKLNQVTDAVNTKTNAFKEEGKVVSDVIDGEVNSLNPLQNLESTYNEFKKFYDNNDLESEAGAQAALSYYNAYKEALVSKINKKDLKPFTIGKMDELFTGNYANYKKGLEELDLSGLNSQISKYQEIIDKFNQPEVVSIINSLTEAIQKLLDAGNTSEQTTKLLTELNKAINNLGGKNSADKIAKIVTNLENFQNAVNTLNISDNEFIQSLSSILEKGEELKVLGEVLKSTKKQIDAAGNAISQKNKLNYAQDLLKNNEVAINESVNKYFSQQGKNVILQSLEATKEGFIEVTAVIEESENAYKRFVFTTTDGSDLKLKKNANATLTEVKQIKAFKEMQQIISHTQIGGLGGNNVFTPDHANWKELVVLAKSFGIELEDIRKIIRNVDKEGQESFQIFTKLSRITIGMDSDNVLFQKDEVLDFNQQIINFQNNVDTLQASLKSSFSGDDKSTQVFLNTLKDIKDTWSTIQALHGEGFGTDEELSDLLKYYNAFKTTISSISLDKISIDNKTPEFIEQFKQAENQLLSLKDVLDKVDSGTPFTDDDIAQIEKFILKMRELNTLAKDKGSKLANFAGEQNLLGKIANILHENTVMSKNLRQQFEQLSLEIKSFGDNLPADKLVEFGGRFKYLERIMKETGQTGLSFFDGIIKRAKSMSQSAISMYLSLYDVIRYIRTGVTYIRELDTALTEMRKVSDETTKSLKRFQDTSFDIAKSVGTTAKQIQESTADFMRLGNP